MEIVKVDWSEADAAFQQVAVGRMRWCVAVTKLYRESGVTQDVIADRYQIPQPRVSDAVVIAESRLIQICIDELPKARETLLRIARLDATKKLDEKTFKQLASPKTKIADVEKVERRLAPPPPKPIVPPKVNESRKLTPEEIKEFLRRDKEKHQPKSSPAYEKDLRWAFAVLGIEGTPRISERSLNLIFRGLTSTTHPDVPGGNTDAMADLNLARTLIMETSLWVR